MIILAYCFIIAAIATGCIVAYTTAEPLAATEPPRNPVEQEKPQVVRENQPEPAGTSRNRTGGGWAGHGGQFPTGGRSGWMLPAGIITALLGLWGSAAGSGGSFDGFILAVILNPILWLAGFWIYQSASIRCPHCGGRTRNSTISEAPLDSVIICRHCQNKFHKTALS